MSRGTTHSCGLTPPCSYSLFASKHVTPGRKRDPDVLVPEPRHGRHVDTRRRPSAARTGPSSTSVVATRQLDLLHAAREQDPAVVGHDVDPLPAGVEQLPDARDDPLDLLVEVVDEPDADVVSSVVDLAGLRPRRP